MSAASGDTITSVTVAAGGLAAAASLHTDSTAGDECCTCARTHTHMYTPPRTHTSCAVLRNALYVPTVLAPASIENVGAASLRTTTCGERSNSCRDRVPSGLTKFCNENHSFPSDASFGVSLVFTYIILLSTQCSPVLTTKHDRLGYQTHSVDSRRWCIVRALCTLL